MIDYMTWEHHKLLSMNSDDKMRNWILGNCACNTNTLLADY